MSEESLRFFFAYSAVEEVSNDSLSVGPRIEHNKIGTSLTEEQQRLRNDPAGRLQHGPKREG